MVGRALTTLPSCVRNAGGPRPARFHQYNLSLGNRHQALQAGWPLLEQQGFQPLPHRDPFDRLLAAQAELEQLILLTLDPALAPFPCHTL